MSITATALLTNKTPAGTYRAPGRYEASFFCERLIELAAVDLAIDSAEIRRRNLISAAEMPYKLPRLEPGGPMVDTECDSGDYGEALAGRGANERFRCSADACRGDYPSTDRRIRARRGIPAPQCLTAAQHVGYQFPRSLRNYRADTDGGSVPRADNRWRARRGSSPPRCRAWHRGGAQQNALSAARAGAQLVFWQSNTRLS